MTAPFSHFGETAWVSIFSSLAPVSFYRHAFMSGLPGAVMLGPSLAQPFNSKMRPRTALIPSEGMHFSSCAFDLLSCDEYTLSLIHI